MVLRPGLFCLPPAEIRISSATLSECVLTAPVDTTFVQSFLSVELAEEAPLLVRHDLLKHFLAIFPLTTYSDDFKAMALRVMIIPLLRSSLSAVGTACDRVMTLHFWRTFASTGARTIVAA